MPDWKPTNPDFEAQVRQSAARQRMLTSLGATVVSVRAGEVVIAMPANAGFSQQHGFLHAGAVTTIVDSACGYAAYTLMPPGSEVLSVEFKVNLLAPAKGDRMIATGRVIRPGRTLTVCTGEVAAESDGKRTLIALMQATMIRVDAARETPTGPSA